MENPEGTPTPELVNPYIAGAPVTEARMFFGRADVFDWIKNSLAGQYAEHILVVHGQRRVGKTSVLKQLGNRLPERYIPVFFDLQGRTHTSLDRFMWWLAREIVRVLKQDRGIDFPAPERESFTSDIEYFEHRFLPDLRLVLGSGTLLLTFDEFDNLEESEVKEELAGPLIDHLRRLMGSAGLNFIFSIGSSGRKLENMQASYTEFFKTALYKKISFLNEDQTRDLVVRPVEGLIKYERGTPERIYEIASGHPYFTQLTCHELFARCQRTGDRTVARTDIEAVLDDVVERGTVNLKFVWDEASDIEKWSLAAMAQLGEKAPAREVAEFLRGQRVRFVDSDLTSGLLHLKEKDVVSQDDSFVIHLMRLWLRKNRPLEQVREELTEVNPIANRYIEIGMEFKDGGAFDKAIESFQQALAVAPGNVQAQVNVGLTYMDQKAYDKAVVEFEKALAIDDEDVAARAGLCDAHLALGDASMARNRPREAVQSYQRVLAINAEHTEARQRMSEIARARAEKSLLDGKDEEALSAFAEALKYTPEDPTLMARVDAVRAETKARVLAVVVARSEKEAAAKNWAAAIASLEDAIRLAPEDASLREQIAAVREAQRKSELAALLARADQAEKSGHWEQVITALDEYLAQEPGDKKVRERLTGVRETQREALLAALRNKARSLAKAEKHEQALAAWDEYLGLDPADAKEIGEEVERVRKAKSVAEDYAEAQKALARKNYDRAIGLLKGIVVEHADYKDASRLLAQAVELRRTSRRWWHSRWLWGSLGAAAVLALGWLLFRPGSPLPATVGAILHPPTETASTATPGPTYTPSPVPTAIPLTWVRLNSGQFLPRDQITSIVVDPSDHGVMYVGTQNAGVYKSIDAGLSWQPIHNGLGRAPISRLVIDMDDPSTLYASTQGNLYQTSDGGASWQAQAAGRPFRDGDTYIVIDPNDNQNLYFATQDSVYRSTDGGGTWDLAKPPEACPEQIYDHAFTGHPTQSGVLYASNWHEANYGCKPGIYRSTDGGGTWELIGLEGYYYLAQIAVGLDQQGNEVLYATDSVTESTALYASRDGGETWSAMLDEGCPGSLLVDPARPTTVYCGWHISEDGGTTWKQTAASPPDGLTALATLDDGATLIAGTHSGLFISINGGASWIERSSGLANTLVDLRVDPSVPSTFYVSLLDDYIGGSALYRSTDAGQGWNLIETGRGLAIDNDGGIYRIDGNDLLYSRDQGDTWATTPLPKPGEEIIGLGTNPAAPGLVFVVFPGEEVFFSTTYGGTWQESTMPEVDSDYHAARFYFDPDHYLEGYMIPSYLAFRTTDAGSTWEQCADVAWIPSTQSILTIDPRDNDRIVLAVLGRGLHLSEDGCRSWQASSNGLGSLFVNAIAIDPNDPDTLYAGTDGGAYISTDGGRTWGPINGGLLGATVVYSIVVDEQSNVYAATPYGIFMLEER